MFLTLKYDLSNKGNARFGASVEAIPEVLDDKRSYVTIIIKILIVMNAINLAYWPRTVSQVYESNHDWMKI